MARQRYPSDEARVKTRPHVRVHLSARSHRRTGEVFQDVELRGMLVGLWMVAQAAYAGRTGNVVLLDRSQVMWIAGRAQFTPALRALHALCARMEYAVSAHGALTSVHIRNFEQKQHPDSAGRGARSATPHPSYSEDEAEADSEAFSDTGSQTSRESEGERGSTAPAAPPPAPARPKRSALTEAPDVLTGEQMDDLRLWCEGAFPSLVDRLPDLVDGCLDWHRSNGRTRRNWTATFRSWVRKQAEIEHRRPPPPGPRFAAGGRR